MLVRVNLLSLAERLTFLKAQIERLDGHLELEELGLGLVRVAVLEPDWLHEGRHRIPVLRNLNLRLL